MADRYVALGLANPRSVWFREVGKWATAAAIPVDFIRCVSVEELRARLQSGQSFSALLFDAGTPGVDRDLIDLARESGVAVLVVNNSHSQQNWIDLGATAILPQDFQRAELMEELQQHGRPLEQLSDRAAVPAASASLADGWAGHLIAVVSGPGAGGSTVAMGLAQGLGADPRFAGLTLLADLCLDADLAMFHDARDVVPGLQELVDAHRAGTPSPAEVRSMVFAVPERGYDVLLGLRRHRDWAALRPRTVAATLRTTRRSYRAVVTDTDADFEGEDLTGSFDIEERNVLARTSACSADLIIAVGNPTMKGLNDLLRVIGSLVSLGVDPTRILPVLNRSVRSGRQRAEASSAFGELIVPIARDLPSPVQLPDRRGMDAALRDNLRLPSAFTMPLAEAVISVLTAPGRGSLDALEDTPVAVLPGSLGHFTADQGDEVES